MIDWEEVSKTENVDELKSFKVWLFRENMRLENERKELNLLQDKLLKERVIFRDEMDALNRRSLIERKKLKEENVFFDKKMAILQDGFRMLDEDRKKLEREKQKVKSDRLYLEEKSRRDDVPLNKLVEVLFRNANNPMTLRKRYKELVKIFHPDNMCGDEELLQLINKEFMHRREKI